MINMIEPIIPEDGQVRWYLSTKIPFRDQHGRVKGIVGIGRDITQIKNMEADLQKAHDELEERVEQRTLELKKVNQQLAGLYEISQAITAPLQLDLVLNEIAQRTAELMGSDTGVIMLLDGEGESLSIRGAYGVSEEMAKIIHHQIGESVSGCVAQSGQALLVNNLRENAVFYNENAKKEGLLAVVCVPLIFQGRTIGTLSAQSKSNPQAFNPDHMRLLSMLAAQSAIAIENARLYEQLEQARSELEKRVEKRTGELLRINSRLQMEIIERKRAEAEFQALNAELEKRVKVRTRQLEESETFFRSLFENSPDGIVIIDPHSSDNSWKIVDVNPEACRMNGYSREELIGQPIDILNLSAEVDPTDRPAQLEGYRHTRLKRIRITHQRKDGSVFLVDSASCLVIIGGQEFLMGFDRDVTEQVRIENGLQQAHDEMEMRITERTAELAKSNAELINEINERALIEKALSESEEHFKRIINTAREGVWGVDFEGRTTLVNARMAEMLGYSIDEMIDTLFDDYTLPEDMPDHRQRGVKRAAGLSEQYEHRLRRKNGSIIWVMVSATPLFEENGQYQGSMGMYADISEHKKAEKIRETLYQISQAAISTAKLDDLYYSIHRSLAGLMPVENIYIALYDEVNDLFHFPYFVDQQDEQPSPEKPGKGMTGYVLRTGKALLARSEQFDAISNEGGFALLGTLSVDWLGVPLKVENHSIGVLVIQSYDESIRYHEDDRSIMEFVSTQIAMVIERKKADESLRRKLEELTVLHEIADAGVKTMNEAELIDQTTRIISMAFPADNCGILLWNKDEEKLVHQSSYIGLRGDQLKMDSLSGKGIIGHVFASGQSWRIGNVCLEPDYLSIDPRVQSELCVPLKLGERVMGVINIESERIDAFSIADEHLLETIASQVATAIEKFHLFDETRRHLKRLDALHTIDKIITSSMELAFTMGVVIDQGISVMGLDAGDVLLLNLNTQALEALVTRGFQSAGVQHGDLRLSGLFARRLVLERKAILLPDLKKSDEPFTKDLQLGGEGFKAYFGVPILANGQVKGVLEMFSRTPVKPEPEWADFLTALAAQSAIAIDNTRLFTALQQTNLELTVSYDATLEGWTRSLKLRDEDTEDHSQQVTDLTLALAQKMGVEQEKLVHIRRGALLHDIGKIGIPDRILLKPGKLTGEEWAIMRKHPQYAFDLLNPISYLRPALEIPFCHHEKWDGSGYPNGLKGEQIPLAARIFAVVDVWQALTSDRPYRKAWSESEALDYIRTQKGAHFDPDVVDLFLAWHAENSRADNQGNF